MEKKDFLTLRYIYLKIKNKYSLEEYLNIVKEMKKCNFSNFKEHVLKNSSYFQIKLLFEKYKSEVIYKTICAIKN